METLLAFGNGGSATDAMDVVADFREPPREAWPARPAIDLTEDTGIVTAVRELVETTSGGPA